MTKSVVQKGKTVLEAIKKAHEEAGRPSYFKVRILKPGKPGFLGLFGGEPAVVSLEYEIKEHHKRRYERDSSLLVPGTEKRQQRPSQRNQKQPRRSSGNSGHGRNTQNGRSQGDKRNKRPQSRQDSGNSREGSQRGGQEQNRTQSNQSPHKKRESHSSHGGTVGKERTSSAVHERFEEFLESWISDMCTALGENVVFMVRQIDDSMHISFQWDPFSSNRPAEVIEAMKVVLQAGIERLAAKNGTEAPRVVEVSFGI